MPHSLPRRVSLIIIGDVIAGLLFALMTLMSAAGAHAATVLALDLAGLVKQSDRIVIAKAEADSSRYNADHSLIVTDTTLRVIESVKGSARAGDALVVTRLGGSIGDLGLSVPGEASFPAAQSALVFLRMQGGELHVVGMSQGVLPIDGAGASAQVLPSGADAELVQRGSDGKLLSAPGALTAPQSLRALLGQIRRLSQDMHAP